MLVLGIGVTVGGILLIRKAVRMGGAAFRMSGYGHPGPGLSIRVVNIDW